MLGAGWGGRGVGGCRSFKEFPPRAKPGSFNLSEVMDKLMAVKKKFFFF